MPRNQSAVWAMVVAATFFWGSNFNAAGAIAGQLTPLTAASERFGVAVLVLLAMRALRDGAESALTCRDMIMLCVLGLIGVFGFNFAFFTALHYTSALNAALIMALSPLLTSVLAAWLLRAPLHAHQLIGIGLAFLGVALVITGGRLAVLHIALGDVWMLFACCAWSLYSVLVQKYAAHVPSRQQARWTVGAGAVALIAVACAVEQPLAAMARQSATTHGILLYMALCGTVLAYLFWLQGIQRLGPQRAVIAFNLVPVFTLLVNLLFGTWPRWEQCVGMALVFAGVLVATGGAQRLMRSRDGSCGDPQA